MVTGIEKIAGTFYQAGSAHGLEAFISLDHDGVFWLETKVNSPHQVSIRAITPPLAGVETIIEFVDGARFMTSSTLPDRFYGTRASRYRFITWIEHLSLQKAVLLLAVLVLTIFAVHKSIPWFADRVIVMVPKSLDYEIGVIAWQQIDALLFEETELNEAEQTKIKSLFAPIAPKLEAAGFVPRLEMRKSAFLGANAAALPGGMIVITDDLWRAFSDQPAWIEAILAHEAEHVLARHSMRMIARYMGMGAIAFLVGFDESLIEEGAAILGQFAFADHSRDFEREADLGATRILHQIDKDPAAMIQALAGLEAELCGNMGCGEAGWLSTHPDIPNRIAYIREHINNAKHLSAAHQ